MVQNKKTSVKPAILVASVLCLLLLFASAGSLRSETPLPPKPKTPQLPKVTSVEQLMPAASFYVNDMAGVKPGEKVLIVSDRTVNPLLHEALYRAAVEAGAEANLIVLNGFPEMRSSAKMIAFWAEDWWPDWTWEAAGNSNVLLYTTYNNYRHAFHEGVPASRWFSDRNVRIYKVRGAPELMAWEPFVNFPAELGKAIAAKVVEQLPRGRVKVRMVDPAGTDITCDLDYTNYIDGFLRSKDRISTYTAGGTASVGSLHVNGNPRQFGNATGVIVASAMHVGPIDPPVRMRVENGLITGVEGGGEVGAFFRQRIQEYKEVDFGRHDGPGTNYLEEISFQTHPKYAAVFDPGESNFSNMFSGWMGARRAGVIHMAIGSGSAKIVDGKVTIKKQHWDLEFYAPTYWVDGKKIIDNGRLLVLDDPEIRRIAAKYGDPDELLSIEWMPEIPVWGAVR